MRLERLNNDKIKIFLTFDDLVDRGLSKEDLWHDSLKVHQLFRDMIEEASDELGFEANGPIAVEVYSLQAQGMVVIVTRDVEEIDFDDEEFVDDYIEMQVTLDESDDIFYEFQTFEDVIQLSTRLISNNITTGTLYSYNNRFYLLFEDEGPIQTEDFVSILAEFGNPSTITTYRVEEYGKKLMNQEAIKQIYNIFIDKTKNL
ncbi:genetic competence negative regulator [Bacillus luteolus]|uniref:Adapter protein MecA n=1 Tax=Litchfieldia luteola TaxID=682179 RepID=A0ABR9QP76_9BACI|nr:genetic competence negative regulator [Cytobacillus luteolus]MBE4910315.1 genetic competence negative regulator [Cytobacillus luteolus]MBP1942110.1 adapter protein MecA 1/2 [Cytobacillus luteolus]